MHTNFLFDKAHTFKDRYVKRSYSKRSNINYTYYTELAIGTCSAFPTEKSSPSADNMTRWSVPEQIFLMPCKEERTNHIKSVQK